MLELSFPVNQCHGCLRFPQLVVLAPQAPFSLSLWSEASDVARFHAAGSVSVLAVRVVTQRSRPLLSWGCDPILFTAYTPSPEPPSSCCASASCGGEVRSPHPACPRVAFRFC